VTGAARAMASAAAPAAQASTAAAAAAAAAARPWPYKMADLCRLSGMPRQAIHFYIQQGIVPPGHKTGRNTARYGEVHVERIRVVKELQAERFMPLKAIRAVLDGHDEAFTPAQRTLLVEVKQRLAGSLAKARDDGKRVDADGLLSQSGLDRRDLADMVGSGVIEVQRGPRGERFVSGDDVWAFELLGQVRRAGFTRKLGFDAKLLAIYAETVSSLVEQETRVLAERLDKLPPDRVAAMLEQAMPLVHQFFARFHAKKVRDFLVAIEE
jgi:DNA-binding transcriptional MerR regulator